MEKHLCWRLFIIKLQAFRPLMIYLAWQNFAREKWWYEVAVFYAGFFFCLFYFVNWFLSAKVAARLESMLIYLDSYILSEFMLT